MDKGRILKNGNNSQVLKYILETDNFTIEDYRLLVSNDKAKNQEYIIPMIRYKFNLDPEITMFGYAAYWWQLNIAKHIKFNMNDLDKYLDEPDVYTDEILKEAVQKESFSNSLST